MSKTQPLCERCGAPACVHITNEESDATVVRHLCLDCAADRDHRSSGNTRHLNVGALMIFIGLLGLSMSLFADILEFGGTEGFGWYQRAGVVLAGLLVLVGAVTRVPTVLVIGLAAGGLAILADLVAFGQTKGFGWQQAGGAALSVVLIVGGLLLGRRRE